MPFFSFPKVLTHEKEKIRLMEKAAAASATGSTSGAAASGSTATKSDTGYGKDIKGKSTMIAYEICSRFQFSKSRL